MANKHHEWGFSKWPALMECAHYESDDKESAEAKAGTENHVDFSEYINEINTGVPALHDNDNARWAAKFIKEVTSADPNCVVESEKMVEISGGEWANGVFGTCDAYAVVNDVLHVFDYKSGAKSNVDHMPQVMGYAYALLSMLDCSDKEVHCYVLYGAGREVDSRTFDLSALKDNAKIIDQHHTCKDLYHPKANGYCRYCKHSKECKAMAGNIIEFKNNTLTSMSNAALYDWLVSAKAAIEKWMADLKEIAVSEGGALDDGTVRYEIKTDRRGRMTSVDVAQLWYDMSARGCSVTQEQLMKACTITKKAFTDLYKSDAKSNGMLVKDVESAYGERCTFGEPASKLVKVEVKCP